jgi:hypothetical protein
LTILAFEKNNMIKGAKRSLSAKETKEIFQLLQNRFDTEHESS